MVSILQRHLPPGQAAQAMARLPAMQAVAPASQEARYLRSESQRVRRLPGSDAVIFTIDITVIRRG